METAPQREPRAVIPLLGGQLTPGIVRVGNTVRRPAKGNTAFVHDLLLFLEDQGFPFAPRFFGRDEQDRDILSYLEGETWPGSGCGLSDELLEQAARAIRRSHDATAGSPLAHGHEIVAHHELGPHNTIFQGGYLVGFIDWDDAALQSTRSESHGTHALQQRGSAPSTRGEASLAGSAALRWECARPRAQGRTSRREREDRQCPVQL